MEDPKDGKKEALEALELLDTSIESEEDVLSKSIK
jgi:hypothetical protein